MTEAVVNRRLKILSLIVFMVFLLLAGRMWLLQIVRGDRYDSLAEANRIRTIPIRAPRGSIYDRDGRLVAANRRSYTVSVVPSGLVDPGGEVVATLSRLLDMTPEEIEERVRQGGDYPYEPIRIKRDVPIETVIAVEEARNRLPGVLVEEEWVREYPIPSLSGHILGYLGLASRDDLSRGYSPTDLLGKTGIESSYEHFLRGTDGVRRVEVNALSRPIRALESTPPIPGMDVRLSLDFELQLKVEEILQHSIQELREDSDYKLAGAGAAIVLDARTGDILAMVSYPSFDPGRMTGSTRADYIAELDSDPFHPWLNRAIRAFPPGSTFKVVTAVAILEEGALTPETVYNADGRHKYGKRDWTIHQGLPPAGPVTIVEAMGRSTNDFFWEFALRPETGGIRGIAAWATKFGLGERVGIELDESVEMRGLVPTPEWKRDTFGEPWYESETMDVAIGQGFLQVTPLQMAQLYMGIANSGIIYQPRLVQAVTSPDGRIVMEAEPRIKTEIAASPSTWRALREGLRSVVQWSRGTARQAFIGADYDPAGKTGSVQTGRAAHGWFAGFAPAEDPEIIVVVFAEHGESGARVARIGRRIMDEYFKTDENTDD